MSNIQGFLTKKTKAELIVLCQYYKQNIYLNKNVLVDSLIRCNITEKQVNNILSKNSCTDRNIRKLERTKTLPNNNMKFISNDTSEIICKCRKLGEISSVIRSVDNSKHIGHLKISDYIVNDNLIETILTNTYGISNYHYLKNDTIFNLVNELSSSCFNGNSTNLNGKYGIPNIEDRIKLVKLLLYRIYNYKEINVIVNTILN